MYEENILAALVNIESRIAIPLCASAYAMPYHLINQDNSYIRQPTIMSTSSLANLTASCDSDCNSRRSAEAIIIIIIIIKNKKIRVTLCENAAGALYIVNNVAQREDFMGGPV